MINRSPQTKSIPLNIVGSSVFGRYPDISVEKTYNMFESDNWMVPYAGYQIAIPASKFADATEGRASHTSTKLNKLIVVMDENVYAISISFNQRKREVIYSDPVKIGELQTTSGIVYIAENNKPQIAFSDGVSIYIYDEDETPSFQIATRDGTLPISFIPGRIDFHDTYFLCAARSDGFYSPPANNTWRLSPSNNGLLWPDEPANIGLIETKPDNIEAVVRFPSKGNMVFVMGKNVTEPWFDVGLQLFPYQRNTSSNIDYGCLNPATIATIDELVVWLAINEKSGPTIMYSEGGMPEKISTDGIDYLLSNLQNPEDSQAFMYRQDGHIFYHINFYSDNLSLFIDFNTKKIYHACDENGNYFIASSVSFFNNQYYFVSKNNGNLYVFDTIFTTYDGEIIPRIRVCKNFRLPTQEYFIANDLGFTIETGQTDYLTQEVGPIYLITEDGNRLITEGDPIYFISEDGDFLITENGNNLVSEQVDPDSFEYLIAEQPEVMRTNGRVDVAISIDGGNSFGSYDHYDMPPIGHRKNKLAFWQLGASNDLVCQFRFYGLGRFVVTDGVLNIRQ